MLTVPCARSAICWWKQVAILLYCRRNVPSIPYSESNLLKTHCAIRREKNGNYSESNLLKTHCAIRWDKNGNYSESNLLKTHCAIKWDKNGNYSENNLLKTHCAIRWEKNGNYSESSARYWAEVIRTILTKGHQLGVACGCLTTDLHWTPGLSVMTCESYFHTKKKGQKGRSA